MAGVVIYRGCGIRCACSGIRYLYPVSGLDRILQIQLRIGRIECNLSAAVVSADHEHTKRCVYDCTALVSILHIGIHHRRFPGKVIGIHIRCRAIILYAHPAIVGRAGDLYCRSL